MRKKNPTAAARSGMRKKRVTKKDTARADAQFEKKFGFSQQFIEQFGRLVNIYEKQGFTRDEAMKAAKNQVKAMTDALKSVKNNPTPTKARAVKSNPSKIKWATYKLPDGPVYQAFYKGYGGSVFKNPSIKNMWTLLVFEDNEIRNPLGLWDSVDGTVKGAKDWFETVVDNRAWEGIKKNPTATRAPARSRTKLVSNGREKNPVKPKEMTVYQVQYRRPNMKLFEPWATVMYLPMAKDIARRLADDPIAKNWTIKVESIKVKS
jgi:hypothetical protein